MKKMYWWRCENSHIYVTMIIHCHTEQSVSIIISLTENNHWLLFETWYTRCVIKPRGLILPHPYVCLVTSLIDISKYFCCDTPTSRSLVTSLIYIYIYECVCQQCYVPWHYVDNFICTFDYVDNFVYVYIEIFLLWYPHILQFNNFPHVYIYIYIYDFANSGVYCNIVWASVCSV